MARSPSLALQGWDGINQCEGLLRIATIRAREVDGKRKTTTVTNQVTLAAQLGPVGRIRSRLGPPKTARTEQLSTTARDQSICPKRASQSSREKVASPAERSGSVARCLPLASRATFAS